MIVALLTALFIVCTQVLILFLVYRKVRARWDSFFYSKSADVPSEFAATVSNMSDLLASRLLEHFKMSALGTKSGDSRNQKILEGAVVKDMAGAQNPLMGMLMQLPTVSKLIDKRPELLQYALPLLEKFKGGGNEVAKKGSPEDYSGIYNS